MEDINEKVVDDEGALYCPKCKTNVTTVVPRYVWLFMYRYYEKCLFKKFMIKVFSFYSGIKFVWGFKMVLEQFRLFCLIKMSRRLLAGLRMISVSNKLRYFFTSVTVNLFIYLFSFFRLRYLLTTYVYRMAMSLVGEERLIYWLAKDSFSRLRFRHIILPQTIVFIMSWKFVMIIILLLQWWKMMQVHRFFAILFKNFKLL